MTSARGRSVWRGHTDVLHDDYHILLPMYVIVSVVEINGGYLYYEMNELAIVQHNIMSLYL